MCHVTPLSELACVLVRDRILLVVRIFHRLRVLCVPHLLCRYIHLASVDALQVKNLFTPYVFLAMAGVCFVLAAFILVQKVACARPTGQAKFNEEW